MKINNDTSMKGSKFEKVSLGTLDSLIIVVFSHIMQFVKFHNLAEIKQGTHVKMLSCKKALYSVITRW